MYSIENWIGELCVREWKAKILISNFHLIISQCLDCTKLLPFVVWYCKYKIERTIETLTQNIMEIVSECDLYNVCDCIITSSRNSYYTVCFGLCYGKLLSVEKCKQIVIPRKMKPIAMHQWIRMYAFPQNVYYERCFSVKSISRLFVQMRKGHIMIFFFHFISFSKK